MDTRESTTPTSSGRRLRDVRAGHLDEPSNRRRLADGQLFDVDSIVRNADQLAREFRKAEPFPHVVIDDCLRLETSAVDTFPDADWPSWRGLGDVYQMGKLSCSDRAVLPSPWGELIDELNSPRTLALLEKITGIPKLTPDPYLEGGGLHMSGPGGILQMHSDFHVYTRLDLYRRLNLLLYLCPDWSADDGGSLELADAKRSRRGSVVPAWGRCVLFETNDNSVHGFTDPVAPNRYRRSIALYYYTAAETPGFSGDATTHWREHGEHRGARKARHVAFRGLMQTSRAFSLAAHLVNPNQGLGWWRTRRARVSERA